MEVVQKVPESSPYPIQLKEHGVDFLLDNRHFWLRSPRQVAIMRIRNEIEMAIHDFFYERGFLRVDTPILTAAIGERSGLFATEYFDEGNAFLAQTGQLYGEAAAAAFGKIYTFGPTFRAENSNTSRHAAEFWMIEPEMAFCDLAGDMDVAEEFVKHLIRDARTHCAADLEFFAKFVDKDLLTRLDFVLERPFQRCSYTEAIDLLAKAGRKWEHPVAWGDNLQSEHERYLAEEHFKCPVTLFDYPRTLKIARETSATHDVGFVHVVQPDALEGQAAWPSLQGPHNLQNAAIAVEIARQLGIVLRYTLMDVEADQFRRTVVDFFMGGGKGLNVTLPHKQSVMELVQELSPRAARAGASSATTPSAAARSRFWKSSVFSPGHGSGSAARKVEGAPRKRNARASTRAERSIGMAVSGANWPGL